MDRSASGLGPHFVRSAWVHFVFVELGFPVATVVYGIYAIAYQAALVGMRNKSWEFDEVVDHYWTDGHELHAAQIEKCVEKFGFQGVFKWPGYVTFSGGVKCPSFSTGYVGALIYLVPMWACLLGLFLASLMALILRGRACRDFASAEYLKFTMDLRENLCFRVGVASACIVSLTLYVCALFFHPMTCGKEVFFRKTVVSVLLSAYGYVKLIDPTGPSWEPEYWEWVKKSSPVIAHDRPWYNIIFLQTNRQFLAIQLHAAAVASAAAATQAALWKQQRRWQYRELSHTWLSFSCMGCAIWTRSTFSPRYENNRRFPGEKPSIATLDHKVASLVAKDDVTIRVEHEHATSKTRSQVMGDYPCADDLCPSDEEDLDSDEELEDPVYKQDQPSYASLQHKATLRGAND